MHVYKIMNPAAVYTTHVASSYLSFMHLTYLYQFTLCKWKLVERTKKEVTEIKIIGYFGK